MWLLTRKEMQSLDRIAIDEIGIPSLVLMETAGRAVADRAELEARRGCLEPASGPSSVLAIAGVGNNGGDAVVAARHLADRGLRVDLALIGDRERASKDLDAELSIAARLGIEPIVIAGDADLAKLEALLKAHAVVIDGIFGTGLSRPVQGIAARAIDAINAADRRVIAVDLPSGVDADTGQILGAAVRATSTVTFQFAQPGHFLYPGRELSGQLTVADIGIPRALVARVEPSIELVEHSLVREALPPRRPDTHKGTYGHLLVVAGAPDRPGSALLAARAASRIGAALVTIGSDEETIRRLSPAFEQLMGLSLGRSELDADRVVDALSARTAIAIGPSLEANDATRALVREVLTRARVPAVVDAGALAALGRDVKWMKALPAPIVLTPHPGEMSKLAGVDTKTVQADRIGVARALAAESGAIVVLKGASTVIASPNGRAAIVDRGNPAMATGGTGDVLTGVIGGLLAQRIDAELAARAGVFLHGDAGDRAAVAGGGRLVASDLVTALRVPGPAPALAGRE